MGDTIMAKKKQTKWRYWVWSKMVVEAEDRMRWAVETNWLGGAPPSSTEDLELALKQQKAGDRAETWSELTSRGRVSQ